MRKNLEVVSQFKRLGIDFVPVPIRNEDDKKTLIKLAEQNLDEIIEEIEKEAKL